MLGFACICKSLKENGKFRTVTLKTYLGLKEDDRLKRLRSIAVDNLFNCRKILDWCAENQILLYRFSSDLIPLATYLNQWQWWEDPDILNYCNRIKEAAVSKSVRISMHPDQFCVLNSEKPQVVESSIGILVHHNRFSNLIGNETLVLHVGSAAGGKPTAIERFERAFCMLDNDIQRKIVLENDDKTFTTSDVLKLCQRLHIPMVLDVHHHVCNPCEEKLEALIPGILDTWQGRKPKLHLSSGKSRPNDRSHGDFIRFEDYSRAYGLVGDTFDMMLEAKEKDLAVLDIMAQIKFNQD